MNDHPIALREMSRQEARAHYEHLLQYLRLQRAAHAGVLNAAGLRLLTKSQLAARVALTRAHEGRP